MVHKILPLFVFFGPFLFHVFYYSRGTAAVHTYFEHIHKFILLYISSLTFLKINFTITTISHLFPKMYALSKSKTQFG